MPDASGENSWIERLRPKNMSTIFPHGNDWKAVVFRASLLISFHGINVK